MIDVLFPSTLWKHLHTGMAISVSSGFAMGMRLKLLGTGAQYVRIPIITLNMPKTLVPFKTDRHNAGCVKT